MRPSVVLGAILGLCLGNIAFRHQFHVADEPRFWAGQAFGLIFAILLGDKVAGWLDGRKPRPDPKPAMPEEWDR